MKAAYYLAAKVRNNRLTVTLEEKKARHSEQKQD